MIRKAIQPKMSLLLVTPWFGVGSGGAERAAEWFAAAARTAGLELTVLSTTLGNPFEEGDREAFSPGEGTVAGIPVIRFRPRPRDPDVFAGLRRRIEAGHPLTTEEEREFLRQNVSSGELEAFIRSHPEDLSVFIPYCYGTTVLGAEASERFLLIPCLHDEPMARLRLPGEILARNHGVVFLSEPERELFRALHSGAAARRACVTGLGAPARPPLRPERVRVRGLPEGKRVLLFLGRRHPDKGLGELVLFFDRYVREEGDRSFVLALAGPGAIECELPSMDHVVDLGTLSEEEKWDAIEKCFALVHPSTKESFSIVLMEAWACERPVVVHEDCAVTRWHVERANGGLWFGDFATFAGCLGYLADHPDEAAALGRQGREYVHREYNPESVSRAFTDFLSASL